LKITFFGLSNRIKIVTIDKNFVRYVVNRKEPEPELELEPERKT
jgi:hypothetical protein